MTILAVGVMDSRTEDWLLVGLALVLVYILLYPSYILIRRSRYSRMIRKQLITTPYNLPIKMTPTELSYIFSPSIKSRHLYATLLDLANRSVVVIKHKSSRIYVESGPKIDNELSQSEKLLTDSVFKANEPIPIEQVMAGYATAKQDRQRISGSKHYVFWWLLRDQLRKRKIIEARMVGRYTRMLFIFGLVCSFLVSMLAVGIWRLAHMLDNGELEFSHLWGHFGNALFFWLILLLPIILVSFMNLRLRGKMLGRQWLLTKSNIRYSNQLILFKEYVRLANKGALRFDVVELQKESIAHTKPYAIALGYAKETSLTGK